MAILKTVTHFLREPSPWSCRTLWLGQCPLYLSVFLLFVGSLESIQDVLDLTIGPLSSAFRFLVSAILKIQWLTGLEVLESS